MMGMGTYAKLLPNMELRGKDVGTWRQDNAVENNRDPGTSPVPEEEQLQNNINAAWGERATQILVPKLHWYDYREHGFRGLPDLGDFLCLDTKSTMWSGPDPWLKVAKRNGNKPPGPGDGVEPHWIYVLAVGDCHPYWWFPGWLWGHEVRLCPVEYHRGLYYVVKDIKLLRPIYEMQRIYAERLKQYEQEKRDA